MSNQPTKGKKRGVIFDLQGTLGGEGLGNVLDFEFFPFAITAVKLINDAGLTVIVITNQSRISKGYFTLQDFTRRIDILQRQLALRGARFDAVYCCPHTRHEGCTCHKPRPGLVFKARDEFNLDLSVSYVVGDSGAWDLVLARNIGATGILVRTGLGVSSLNEYRYLWSDIEPDLISLDVLQAARWIVATEACQPNHKTAEQSGYPDSRGEERS